MDPEPGEIVFFDGHPSWLSLSGLAGRGLLAAVAAGVVAGVATAINAGHVQTGWVIAAVAAVFLVLFAIGQLRRIQTTYSITNQRLTIETGILSRDLHQTRLERVQNVNATQSLGERILHIARSPSTRPARPSSTSPSAGSATPARSSAPSTARCTSWAAARTRSPPRACRKTTPG